MPTIIDSLIVTLGLDGSKFEAARKKVDKGLKDTGQQSARSVKDIEAWGKGAASAMAGLRNQVLGLLGAYASIKGISSFVESTVNADAATGRLAKNLGMSVEDLSAWEGAVKRAGGTAEGMAGSLRAIEGDFQSFILTGQSQALPLLNRLGLDFSKVAKNDLTGYLEDLADKLHQLSPAEAQAFGSGMGLDEGTINLLQQGRGAVATLLAEQRRLGTANADSARSAQELQKQWLDMLQPLESIGRTILTDVTPAVKALLEQLDAWLADNREFIEQDVSSAIRDLGHWLKSIDWQGVRDGAREFKDDAKEIISLLGGWTRAGEILLGLWVGSKFLSAFSGIASVVGLLRGAGGGLGILGKLGVFGAAVSAGLAGAKALGLPDTNGEKGRQDVAKGDWLAASADLPASEFIGAVWDRVRGGDKSKTSDSLPDTNGEKGAPRGIRNNNPGNLNFAGQEGASKEDGPGGRFAVFQSMEEGIAALAKQLQRYGAKGVDTIRGIISKFAPSSENDTGGYIAAIEKWLGIGADQRLDLSDNKTLKALISGISTIENGKGRVSGEQIDAGLALNTGSRLDPALLTGATGAAIRANPGGSKTENHITTEVKVGEVNIVTQATDAKGIAKDIGAAVGEKANWDGTFNKGVG